MPLAMENIKYSQGSCQVNINLHMEGLFTSVPVG